MSHDDTSSDYNVAAWVQNWPRADISKREYFAAMAMQGILNRDGVFAARIVALSAVICADALIAGLDAKDP